jgi:hypothetical protein
VSNCYSISVSVLSREPVITRAEAFPARVAKAFPEQRWPVPVLAFGDPPGVKLGRELLEVGITTVRDVGNSGVNGDVALRKAIQRGAEHVTAPAD